MRKIVWLIIQVIILCSIYWLGNKITLLCSIPIPGNILGMVLLFGLLSCGVIKVQQVQSAADLLLKHMVFFFVPIAVGLMKWGTLFYENGIVLALAIIVSGILSFLTVGFLVQWLQGRKIKCNN